jgi:hypothetical protein
MQEAVRVRDSLACATAVPTTRPQESGARSIVALLPVAVHANMWRRLGVGKNICFRLYSSHATFYSALLYIAASQYINYYSLIRNAHIHFR